MPWYLRWLGFSVSYQCKVLDEPVQNGEDWIYTVKPISYTYTWLGIKLKIIKLEETPEDKGNTVT